MFNLLNLPQRINTWLNLGSWAYWAFGLTGLSAAAVIAWATSTWEWYWLTFKWAGIAFAFLCSWLAIATGIFLIGYGVDRWRGVNSPPNAGHDTDDKFGSATVTLSPPAIRRSMYVGDIRIGFSELERDRHSEIMIRVFNGTGRVIEFSKLSGHINFNAPNSTDPLRMGQLPPPAMRPDTAKTVNQLDEWFLILTQRVPAAEADKILAMLKGEIPIHFDFSGLKIEIFAKNNPSDIEQVPLWHGVSYSKGNGFGKIISVTVNMTMGAKDTI